MRWCGGGTGASVNNFLRLQFQEQGLSRWQPASAVGVESPRPARGTASAASDSFAAAPGSERGVEAGQSQIFFHC